MPRTPEELFIHQLKNAYVKQMLEIGDKNREIRRLERQIERLERNLSIRKVDYGEGTTGDRVSVQRVRTSEGDMSPDRPAEEAL